MSIVQLPPRPFCAPPAAPALPDSGLRRAVAHALAADPATAACRVHARAARGVLILRGLVASRAQQQQVVRVVRGVRGVRRVVAGQLLVAGRRPRPSDEEINTHICQRLAGAVGGPGALVLVHTAARQVHLAGTVATAAAHGRLVALAYQAGADHVHARNLRVACPPPLPQTGHEKTRPHPNDDAIAAGVRHALQLNPRLDAAATLVQVHHGVLTLAGTVGSPHTRRQAEAAARRVAGVAAVHNLLKARPAARQSEPLHPPIAAAYSPAAHARPA